MPTEGEEFKYRRPDLETRRKHWKPTKPLPALSEAEEGDVFARLRDRAVYGQLAHDLATEARNAPKAHHADPERVRAHIKLVRALRQASKITFAEYVVQVGSSLESVVDHRHSEEGYASELDPISEAMRKVEIAHGLGPDQYWMRADMPDDYAALSDAYEDVITAKLPLVADEFGEGEIADLLRTDRSAYDTLREQGRLSIFEKENTDAALTALVTSYEDQASRATEAQAYLAGCVMWGAAAEARLLLRCLQNLDAALAARDELGRNKPRRNDPTQWTLEQLVMVVTKAGWLGVLEDHDFIFYVEGLIGQLRSVRNLIHPGRSIVERPHLMVDAAMCNDARTAYFALRLAVQKRLAGEEVD